MACSLGGSESAPSPTPRPPVIFTPTPLVSVTPLGTPFVIATATLPPTGAAVPNPGGGQVVATRVNCLPQTGWPVYTVVAGDTLGFIAQRTGSTVAQLAQANCLANTELIYIGQRLYVPALPAVATPIPSPNPNLPVFGQSLTVDPFWLDAFNRPTTYSDVVRINAGDVLNASRVVFYVNDPAGGPAIQVGSDEDPWDGAFVDYAFPTQGSYTFQALALNEANQASSTAFTIIYDPGFSPPGGQRNLLSITPYLAYDGGWYTLQPGITVAIAWPDAPVGATRVDFTLAPTGTGTTPQTIGTDLNPADGSLITWNVTSGITAHLQGVATMPDGSTVTSELVNVVSG
jgi:hypothetical protein